MQMQLLNPGYVTFFLPAATSRSAPICCTTTSPLPYFFLNSAHNPPIMRPPSYPPHRAICPSSFVSPGVQPYQPHLSRTTPAAVNLQYDGDWRRHHRAAREARMASWQSNCVCAGRESGSEVRTNQTNSNHDLDRSI